MQSDDKPYAGRLQSLPEPFRSMILLGGFRDDDEDPFHEGTPPILRRLRRGEIVQDGMQLDAEPGPDRYPGNIVLDAKESAKPAGADEREAFVQAYFEHWRGREPEHWPREL